MWKRDQQPKPTLDVRPSPIQTPVPPAPPVEAPPAIVSSSSPERAPATPPVAAGKRDGASLLIKGEIAASEDLVLHGRIEGKLSLPEHMLTIGPQAEISADIVARVLIIEGTVTGNAAATEKFEIRSGGRMIGNVVCPNVVMSEGSEFTGGVDMRRTIGASTRRTN
jgi:cytoskeletal protein CcmA (bactofilin family)